jgi:uncharacterized membrane protein
MKGTTAKVAVVLSFCAACCLSALMGGAFSRNLVNSSLQISYADLIAVMLTGVTTLLAIVAVGIAAMAFFGWNAIENTVNKKAEQFLDDRFKKGGEQEQELTNTAQVVFLNYLKSGMDENDPVFREIRNILEQERYKDVPDIVVAPKTPSRRKGKPVSPVDTNETVK